MHFYLLCMYFYMIVCINGPHKKKNIKNYKLEKKRIF